MLVLIVSKHVLRAVYNCFELQGHADCEAEDSARCSTLFVLIALVFIVPNLQLISVSFELQGHADCAGQGLLCEMVKNWT